MPLLDPELVVRRLDPDDLTTRFDHLDSAAELAASDFLRVARTTVAGRGCEPVLRSFAPASLPVLFLEGKDARRAADRRAGREEADGIWAQLLDEDAPDESTQAQPLLVFNYRNPLVERLVGLADAHLLELSTEALFAYAILAGNRPLRPEHVAGVNRAFLGLVEHAVQPRR